MPMLSIESARGLIDTLALLLLATALGSVLTHQLRRAIWLLAVQGLLLAATAAVIALSTHEGHAYFAVALTLTVKVVLIPWRLSRALREAHVKSEVVEVVLPRPLALLIAIGLVLVAYRSAASLLAQEGFVTRNALPVALALLLVGMFSILTRTRALGQVIGLVTMENGLYLAAVVATQGLPLAVELGVSVDVLVLVLVLGVVVRQMHHTLKTTEIHRLPSPRG